VKHPVRAERDGGAQERGKNQTYIHAAEKVCSAKQRRPSLFRFLSILKKL
jgi:hypothetical protein